MRRAEQLAVEVVGPAVQRADDVGCRCCRGRAASPPGGGGRRSRAARRRAACAPARGLRLPAAGRDSRRHRAPSARGRRSAGRAANRRRCSRSEQGRVEVAASREAASALRASASRRDAQVGHDGREPPRNALATDADPVARGWLYARGRRSKGRGLYPAGARRRTCRSSRMPPAARADRAAAKCVAGIWGRVRLTTIAAFPSRRMDRPIPSRPRRAPASYEDALAELERSSPRWRAASCRSKACSRLRARRPAAAVLPLPARGGRAAGQGARGRASLKPLARP